MTDKNHWVSEWLEQTEELEADAFEKALVAAKDKGISITLADSRERAMERKALMLELSRLLGEIKELEDKLWKNWR